MPRVRGMLLVSLLLLLAGLMPPGRSTAAGLPAPPRIAVRAGVSPTDPLPAPARLPDGVLYFAETGHNLHGVFRAYWDSHHGSAVLGLPLTDDFNEQYTDGSARLVQYFERGVLEYNPNAPAGRQVTPR